MAKKFLVIFFSVMWFFLNNFLSSFVFRVISKYLCPYIYIYFYTFINLSGLSSVDVIWITYTALLPEFQNETNNLYDQCKYVELL